MKPVLLSWLALVLASWANPSALRGAESSAAFGRQPNIVFILTDDQGYGDLSCHGNPILKTPHLDRLHAESARFTDFHASPTCSPTRCALMTGRHEFKSGVTHTILERERMSLKATTVVQALKSAGYQTGIFGKWHLGDEDAYQPNRRGFDETFVHGAGGIGQTYPGSCGDAPDNRYFDPVIRHNGVFVKTRGYCTDVFFSQALRWIDQQRRQPSPFFAYLACNAPHAPLDCPPGSEQPYLGKVGTNVARFYGMIANIDENVGRLLAQLERWNLTRDTLVVFMTDNGTATGQNVFNAGLRGGKGTPYLGGTRVPSFWRWPGQWAPGDRPQLTAHVDFFPTLVELAGGTVPGEVRAKLEGRSLVPLLREAQHDWPERSLFTHFGRWPRGKASVSKYAQCAVRQDRYTLVSAARNGERAWQLFDVKTDPGQKKDLASAHPALVSKLESAYDQWWATVLPCLENEQVTGPAINPFKAAYWKQFEGGPTDALLKEMDPTQEWPPKRGTTRR